MAARVFVTGGSGFVGARLLPALGGRGYSVVALDRSGMLQSRAADARPIEVVRGDLLEPDTYEGALARTTIVVHLAASTGRASQVDHFRVNAQGTDVLLAQCRRAGIEKIVFVSSIAAKFPDTTHYYYAQAKIHAEAAVRRSGLRFAILRPTMILGQGSPVLTGLEKLATLPVIPVFGNGRTKVQPIYVDDVVEFILTVLDEDMFSNETFEIGGPAALTIEDLLQGVRQARRGGRGRAVHVPLGLVLAPLRIAEAVGLGGVMPVTAGQLSSFQYDGTVAANWLHESRRQRLISVSQMLSASFDDRIISARALDGECRVFVRHLLRCDPDAYVLRKYAEAHDVLAGLTTGDRFDACLVGFARIHPVFTKIADAYSRVFAPGSVLRRKLIVLLSVLETCAPFHRRVGQTISGRITSVFARLAVKAGTAGISLVVGTVIFAPTRLACAVIGRRTR